MEVISRKEALKSPHVVRIVFDHVTALSGFRISKGIIMTFCPRL